MSVKVFPETIYHKSWSKESFNHCNNSNLQYATENTTSSEDLNLFSKLSTGSMSLGPVWFT